MKEAKTVSPGELAAAIAHQFNEELTVLLNQVTLSLERLGPRHPALPWLLDAQRSAWRCAEITRGLLTFTRRARAARSTVSLKSLL